jgi:hypothetical protein
VIRGVLVCVVATSIFQAPVPDVSGTWRLDDAKSTVAATAGFIGLISAGVPKTLHITQPANGSVVIESQINEAHVRIYTPGRETSTPAGQGGVVTMMTTWAAGALTSEGAMKAPNGDATTVREVLSLSADRKALTIAVTTSGGTAGKPSSSTLVYARITDVGGCETWPTPCKRSP